MKNRTFLRIAFILSLLSYGSGNQALAQMIKPVFKHFITRSGDKLMEGDKEYRFFGLAAPNIQQNESQIREDRTNRFPDEFEIRDIYSGIQRTGGLATRTFSLSIYHPDDKGMPVYIPARRNYNEEAFQCLYRVIALAHE